MKASDLRIIVGLLVLIIYALICVVLAISWVQLWISPDDIKKICGSLGPVFAGYVGSVISYFFGMKKPAGKPRSDVKYPKSIAWALVSLMALSALSIPLTILLFGRGAEALPTVAEVVTALNMEQTVVGALLGAMIIRLLPGSPQG